MVATATTAAAVFALSVLGDFIWVALVRSSVEGRAAQAAGWSMAIALTGYLAVALMVTTSWVLAVPAVLGQGLGTYIAVRRGRVARQA